MTALQPAPEETPGTALRHGRLGVIGIVFFVVAAAAPLLGMTGAAPVAIVLGNGAAVPGAYVAVGIVLLLFSVGYAAMSQKVTNAGAFFAYVGRGLGVTTGVGSAFVSLLAYFTIQLAVYGFFSAVLAGQMSAQFGIDLAWWVWALIAWAIVLGLSVLSVDVGAKVLGVLMSLELLALFVTATAVFIKGGPEGIDLGASFAPGNIFVGGFAGPAGIALAFAFASFIGFEATALYGEEAKEPHKTVPRATYAAVGLITVFFAYMTLAIVTALGASTVVDETVARSTLDGTPLADPAAVVFSIAAEYVGDWMPDVMSWLVISSAFAGLLAFQNSSARYFFAMGRAGVLPSALDRVNGRGAPVIASATTSAISLLVILWFIIQGLDPILNMFYWFSALAVVAIVFVEILVSLAVIVYFYNHRGDATLWTAVIAPALSIVGLALGLWLLTSHFGLLAGTVAEDVDPTTQLWGLNTTGWILVLLPFVFFAIGLIVGEARRRKENVDAVADLVT
ncbi:MAG: APC family permease [Candidatus Nanopelagicales bacterium]